jgi:hypothetical protein
MDDAEICMANFTLRKLEIMAERLVMVSEEK